MKTLLIILAILLSLSLVAWIGLQINPKPFDEIQFDSTFMETSSLPADFPEPVQQFFGELYGKEIPIVNSALVSGRGKLRVMGIVFPARFRFVYEAGERYYHFIETTFFGYPVMKVYEEYIGGKSRLELPFGVEEGPKVDQGANLALWAESVWFPSYLASSQKVKWSEIDSETSQMTVPFGEENQNFIVRFDPESGLISIMESMRFKGSASEEKILWLNQVIEWSEINGFLLPETTSVTWFDEGTPWAIFEVEEVVYNVDVENMLDNTGK